MAGLGMVSSWFLLGILTVAASAQDRELRVITYNVHSFGPVASGDAGKRRLNQMMSRGQCMQRFALELQLYEPDVIALQEAHSEQRVKQFAEMLGMDYAYFPGGWKGKGWPEGICGAILSKKKIVEREDRPSIDPTIPKDKVFSRVLGRVVIEHDGGEVAVYCAHMLPSWENTTHIREAEIGALTVAVDKDRAKGRSVIVMGDMNHDPQTPEYRLWKQAELLDAAQLVAKPKPRFTCPSERAKERIDYVFVGGALRKRLKSARALGEGAFVIRDGDESAYALSDHLPVLAVFR